MWEAELELVRARVASLDIEAETRAARADAVRWREATAYASFFVPLPPVALDMPEARGGWIAEGEFALLTESVGVDALGRPVMVISGSGTEHEFVRSVFRYPDDGVIERLEGAVVERIALEDGRAVRVIWATTAGHARVRLVTWRDGIAVRADGARSWKGDDARAEARVATHERVWSAEEERPAGGGLAGALARARGLEPIELVWDARTQAGEPWPEDAEAQVEPLARALDAALRAAAAASGIEAPFCLHVRNGDAAIDPRPAFPPTALLAGVAFRDGMRRMSARERLTAEDLERGVAAGDVAELELAERLDDDALRFCRALSAAMDPTTTWESIQRAAPVASAIGERLAELLHAQPLPGAAEPFLALVAVGGSYEDPDPLERARRIAGDARVDAFLHSLSPRAAVEAPREAPADRDGLERLLRAHGLDAHAHRIAHEAARDGLQLLPGAGRSRLGGPPLLPRGEPWPAGPLSFLAAIDLCELPPSQVADALPPAGWLLFFAGLDDDDGACVLFTDDPVEASAPPGLDALADRPLALRRVLTLPDDDGAPQRLGLTVYEGAAYRELVESMQPRDARHWLSGLVADAQRYAPEPGTVLLLHLAYDETLHFEFLDDGTLQFRIPEAALAERDWSAAVAFPSSA